VQFADECYGVIGAILDTCDDVIDWMCERSMQLYYTAKTCRYTIAQKSVITEIIRETILPGVFMLFS
jgi:hypothetical protein